MGRPRNGRKSSCLRDLDRVVRDSGRLVTNAFVDMPNARVTLGLSLYRNPLILVFVSGGPKDDQWSLRSLSAAAAIRDLVRHCPRGQFRPELTTVQSKDCELKGRALKALVVAAWSEAFGLAPVTPAPASQRVATLRQSQREARTAQLALLRGGLQGVKRWNALAAFEKEKAGHFRNVDLAHQRLRGVTLKLGGVRRLDFRGANFTGADLTEAAFWFVEFARATFQGARLDGIATSYAHFTHADLTGATLRQANLARCTLRGANFQRCDLREANLHASRCRNACFRCADLRSARLTAADLRGADFSDAKLHGVDFTRARFDSSMQWPARFTPPATMIRQ